MLQILKEEVHDLLDLNLSPTNYGYMGRTNGFNILGRDEGTRKWEVT
jgi:hypothetical protein